MEPWPIIEDESEEEEEIEVPSLSLEELLLPPTECDVKQLGPTAMAYIGDVVFEMFVRAKKIWPPRKASQLQKQVVALVRGS